MKRRTVLGGLGAAGLASLSGCLGLVGMDEYESSPAGVEEDARSKTGYGQTGVDDIGVEESVGAGPVSETISVTNYLTEHEKAIDMGVLGRVRAALFMVLTTPQVGIAGRNFNPVEDMSASELVELVEDNYDAIGDIEQDDEASITVLGDETTRSRFSADATFEGHDLEIDLHVTEAVEAGEDLLVTIGVYPRPLRSREESNVLALMESVSTDIDVDNVETDAGDGDDGDADKNSSSDSGDGNTNGNSSDGNTSDEDTEDDGVLGAFE